MSDNINNIHKVKMNNKGKKIYLPTTSYMDFFKNNYTIIYPNGGSKEHPANVTLSKEYIEPNPFPGYVVNCIAEICYLNEWFEAIPIDVYPDSWWSAGVKATQLNDGDIHVITGVNYICLNSVYKNYQFISTNKTLPSSHITAAPCRVKVWKVGVIE